VNNLDYSHTAVRKYFNPDFGRLDCSRHRRGIVILLLICVLFLNSILHNKHYRHLHCCITAMFNRILSSITMPGVINSYQQAITLLPFKKRLD
jgi:hypothetical protein